MKAAVSGSRAPSSGEFLAWVYRALQAQIPFLGVVHKALVLATLGVEVTL